MIEEYTRLKKQKLTAYIYKIQGDSDPLWLEELQMMIRAQLDSLLWLQH